MRKSVKPEKVVDFASFVSFERINSGMTQLELGSKLGLTGTYINKIENRVARPSALVLLKIAKIFNLNHDASLDFLRELLRHKLGIDLVIYSAKFEDHSH